MPNLDYKDVQGTYHIASDPNSLYEPSRNSTFDFICTNLEGLINKTSQKEEVFQNAQEVLRLSV